MKSAKNIINYSKLSFYKNKTNKKIQFELKARFWFIKIEQKIYQVKKHSIGALVSFHKRIFPNPENKIDTGGRKLI